MLLYEMFDLSDESRDNPNQGYRDEKRDNSVMKLSDLRKTRLSLAHLNRLRMANDLRKVELESELKQVKTQYAAPSQGGEGMGGMGGLM